MRVWGKVGETTLGSHGRGLQVLDGLFYRFHKRHDGSMADWLDGWMAGWAGGLWLELSWVRRCEWFLLSRIKSNEAWPTACHSTTISTHNGVDLVFASGAKWPVIKWSKSGTTIIIKHTNPFPRKSQHQAASLYILWSDGRYSCWQIG